MPYLLTVGLVLVAWLSANSQTNVIGPPLGLEWGMPYSEVASKLKTKNIDIDKPKEEKKFKLPDGFKVAKVGKYEVLDKKTEDNLACFNSDGELCAFQINLRWFGDESSAKAEQFWEKDLKKALEGKYSGEGFKKHTDPDMDGNIPELAFRDEIGNEVAAFRTSGSNILGKVSLIQVFYTNEEIMRETRKQQKQTEEL